MKKEHQIRFKKTQATPSGEMKFDVGLLELYLAVDGKKDVLSLFREAGLPPAEFKHAIIKLIKLKLIEQVKETTDVASNRFLDRLREVLIEVSGPMGTVLIEDAAKAMNLELSRIPNRKKADFIFKIAGSIPGQKPADQFKEIMLREFSELQSA